MRNTMKRFLLLMLLALPVFGQVVNPGNGSGGPPCTTNSTGNKCIGVSPYLAVSGDWTNAFQQAITDVTTDGGGNIWVPNGVYNINGPLQDTGGANAILTLPSIVYGNNTPLPVGIAIRGLAQPVQIGVPQGAVLQTNLNTANAALLGAYNATGPFGTFTNVYLTLESLTFRAVANPALTMVNMKWAASVRMNHLWFDTGTLPVVFPTNGASAAYVMPTYNNSGLIEANDVTTVGYFTGAVVGEHFIGSNINSSSDNNGLVLIGTYSGSNVTNSISIFGLWCQACVNNIVASGTSNIYADIVNANFEQTTGNGVYDPNNLLHGHLSYHVPSASGSTAPGNPGLNGGVNLIYTNLDNININIGAPIGAPGWQLNTTFISGGVSQGVQSGSGTWMFINVSSASNPNIIWDSSHDLFLATSTANTGAGYTPLYKFGRTGLLAPTAIQSAGTKFTTSGCSVSSTTGGAAAGVFTIGANNCTVVVTINGATGLTATNGWTCSAHDRTAPTILLGGESSSTATTASFPIPVTAGTTDVISFSCTGY